MEKLNTNNPIRDKVLVSENTGMINSIIKIYTETTTQLNQITEAYNRLGFGKLSNIKELKQLFHNTDSFIKNRALETVGEIPSFGGFRMKPEAFLQTLELPDTSALSSKIKTTSEFWQRHNKTALMLDSFEIIDGVVSANKVMYDADLNAHRIFATTEKEIKAYTALKKAVDAYVDLDRVVKELVQGSGGLSNWHPKPERWLIRNSFDQLEINPEFYKTIINDGN